MYRESESGPGSDGSRTPSSAPVGMPVAIATTQGESTIAKKQRITKKSDMFALFAGTLDSAEHRPLQVFSVPYRRVPVLDLSCAG